MLHVFSGTDREKARVEMNKALSRVVNGANIARVSDASSIDDLRAALSGSGMFGLTGEGRERAVILDGIFANEEMKMVFQSVLPRVEKSDEHFFLLEGKLDAGVRRTLQKHAEDFERFDTKKKEERGDIFSLAYALKGGDKKRLWVEYQRALAREEAPEAIHGVLFWGAKDMFLKSSGPARARAERLVADLAELPHEARRNSFDLEYALELYLLGVNKS